MISFVVPAHNEELWIVQCLRSIHSTMETLGETYEVIVVDDSSTDATGRIAGEFGARVVRIERRHISASRNAGARAAQGEFYFFIDADTQANEPAVREGLEILRSGAAGGGAIFEFDRPLPLWGWLLYPVSVWLCRRIRWVGGCFVFCTREAYIAVGGFPESIYAGEEIAFIKALKKVGPFVLTGTTVVTSGRKIDVLHPWEAISLLTALLIRGPFHKSREGLDFLYGQRAQEAKTPKKTD